METTDDTEPFAASGGSAPLESKPAAASGESSGPVGVGGAQIINFRPATEFPLERRQKAHCRCSSVGEKYATGELPSTWINESSRDLECKTCGAIIDPFDYLWALATEGDSLTRNLRNMREEKKALKAQIELLHEQIRELKSEGRKLAKAPKGGGGAEPVTIDFRRHEGKVAERRLQRPCAMTPSIPEQPNPQGSLQDVVRRLVGVVHATPREYVSLIGPKVCDGMAVVAQPRLGEYVICCECGWWGRISDDQYIELKRTVQRWLECKAPNEKLTDCE